MEIQDLKSFSEADLRDMDELMHQLSASSCCTEERLRAVVEDGNSHLFVAREGERIIGCACLCVAHTPEFTLGFVEAVAVLSEYRGRHIGRMLMDHLMAEAKRLGVQSLHLTSNPKRVAANELYRKIGFEKYETNCYTLKI